MLSGHVGALKDPALLLSLPRAVYDIVMSVRASLRSVLFQSGFSLFDPGLEFLGIA